MKKLLPGSILATVTLMFCATASADSVLHIWSCKLHDEATPADMAEWSVGWLKAAKAMDGGSDLQVYVEYPFAADAEGGTFSWVLVAPDATTWGTFIDGYPDSPAEEADEAFDELATCSSSSLWNSTEIATE